MAKLTPKRIDLNQINNGNEFVDGDGVLPSYVNAPIETSAYVQILMEAVVSSLNTTEADNVGTPLVEWINGDVVDGVQTKIFKFKNLKGNVGATPNISVQVFSIETTETARVEISGTTESPLIKFFLPDAVSITEITRTGTDGLVDTYTIYLSDNTTRTFTVTNGFSPTATVVKSGDVATITITDINGTTTTEILDGVGDVDSVNGKVGVVVLTSADLDAVTTNTEQTITAQKKFNKGFLKIATDLGNTVYKDILTTPTENVTTKLFLAGVSGLNTTITNIDPNVYIENSKLYASQISTTGDVSIGGDLTVLGKVVTVDTETIAVESKLITLAKDNTTSLTSPAGLEVPKYDGVSTGGLVFDNNGNAMVGDIVKKADGDIDVDASDLQVLSTRTGLVNDRLVKYDSANFTLVDTGIDTGDVITNQTVSSQTVKGGLKTYASSLNGISTLNIDT